MAQRRRWLNGAIFAMIYAMKHMGRFFTISFWSLLCHLLGTNNVSPIKMKNVFGNGTIAK
jgi:cellulose synthase/poly-beta-1,6-N-acetylglucosamine synthase-like glycosyltransferase